jgi:puromycin-sensitive aminopeptidase
MRERAYGNAETTDLWDAIEAETGEPVRRIMDSWIFQGGFPLVSYEARGSTIELAQQPMSYAGGDEVSPRSWSVPLLLRWSAGPDEEPRDERVLLEGETTELTVDRSADWLVLNAASTGFMRIAYSDEQIDRLAAVALEELSPVERYALVDDAYASVLAARTSSTAFLNLIEAMSGDNDRSVWQRLIGGLRQLDRLVDGEARERLQEIAHDVLAPPLANLGLSPRTDDDDRSRQLRGDLVRALGTVAGDTEIQEEAKRLVAAARRDPDLVDATLLAASVEVVANVGDEADFNDFIDSWKRASTPQEEIRYLYALAGFSDPDLVERIHTLVLDGEVRSQNAPFLLGHSLSERDAGQLTWEFIAANWARLNEMFATGSIVRMLEGITTLDRPQQAEATAAFFLRNPVRSGSQTLSQLLEKQRVRGALRQREQARRSRFLAG